MKLRKIAIFILLGAVALALISYESYRSNAEFVNKLASQPDSAEMFAKLEPGIPLKSKITGFFAVMLTAAGNHRVLRGNANGGRAKVTDDELLQIRRAGKAGQNASR